MCITVSILAILFGLLHIIAAATQFKSKDPAARGFAIAMACGGICLVFEAIVNWIGTNPGWMDAISAASASLLICVPAYANGRRSGNLHVSHHIIRGTIALLLVVGFFLW